MTRYPIGTDRRWKRFPWAATLLILATLSIYLWMRFLPSSPVARFLEQGALDPANWTALSLFTYVFLHASVLHVTLNLILLAAFGGDVEDACGPWILLPLYLVAGAAAGAAYLFLAPPATPGGEAGLSMMGASGAASGVMGAHLLLAPAARLRLFAWRSFLPVWVLSAAWVVYNGVMATLVERTGEQGTAYWAHLGGFAFGIVAGIAFRGCGFAREKR